MSNPEDLHSRILRVVAEDVLPALEMDGVRVEVVSIDRVVVRVRLSGTCTGCPSAVRAVVMGIEEELRRRVREVEHLQVVP